MHPLLLALILIAVLILDMVALRLFYRYRVLKKQSTSEKSTKKDEQPGSSLAALNERFETWRDDLAGRIQRWTAQSSTKISAAESLKRSIRVNKLQPFILIELGLIILWSLFVGRAFLNFDTSIWLHGSDFPLNIETHYTWMDFKECGLCALWSGSINGGFPAFSDLLAPILHPVLVISTLVTGVINGTKVTMLASLIMAGIAQWWIARTLGLGRLARLWAGGMAVVGGHLSGRMEMGLIGMALSIANLSLAIAAGLALGIHKRRSDAVWLGVILGFGILCGQGYAQIGFLLCIAPSFAFFLLDDQLKLAPVWKEFAIAGMLSLLIAGILLVPTLHFIPNFGKEIDTGHQSTQPLAYGILNLVIRDLSFFQNESLGKVLLPSIYVNYIGWIPIILAIVALLYFSREHWRRYFFTLSSIFLLLIASSDIPPTTLDKLVPSLVDSLRYPPLIAGLVVPLVLALASIGLDRLSSIVWPKLSLETVEGKKLQVPLSRVLLLIPLGIAILNAYKLGQTWYIATIVPQDVRQFALELDNPGEQWVEPPKNSFVWMPPLIESGHKLTGVFRPWHWKYREPPTGAIQSFLEGEELPQGEIIDKIDPVTVVRIPETHYASIKTNEGQVIPCDAIARGGNIDVHCSSTIPGNLIVEENKWSGWRARRDGERVPLWNTRWLSVDAPAGDHNYSFRYRPLDVLIGFALTAAGLFISVRMLLTQPRLNGSEEPDRSRSHSGDGDRIQNADQPEQKSGGQDEVAAESSADHEIETVDSEEPKRRDPNVTLMFEKLLQSTQKVQKSLSRRIQNRNVGWLFLLACAAYLIFRLIGLTEFPIYFFSDEAVQTILAQDLVLKKFHGPDGALLPTYFKNAQLYNLSLSVYLQVIPYLIFGKSVFVTRVVSVLVSFSGAVAVGLILRDAFRIKIWWAGVLVLSAVPAWFLHSRTAFEAVIFVAMMAWMLYFYLRYRDDHPGNLFAAIAFGALAFYSYRGGQLIVIALAVTLFIMDARYHFSHRKILIVGLGLALILFIPYIRFQTTHQEETYFHLRILETYWLLDIPFGEKLLRFGTNYLQGLDPRYWFAPASRDLSRHIMKGHGHISPLMAPFLLIGLVKGLSGLRQPHHRTTIALAALSPLGGALVGVGITRLLVFVVPVALFTTLGISLTLDRFRQRITHQLGAWLLFSILFFYNSFLLWDAMTYGPTWYQNYGLEGMQFGAKQVFEKAETLAEQDPNRLVKVTPTWANGTDILMRYFIPEGLPVSIGNANGYLETEQSDLANTIFILTPDEYHSLNENPKVTEVIVHDTIKYPDGQPGFFITTFAYSPQASQIFEQEEAERALPVSGTIKWQGQTVRVQYPYLDMGALHHIFDDDAFTLARVYSSNPAVFTLSFEEPITLQGVQVTTGSMDMALSADVHVQNQSSPFQFSSVFKDLPNDPTVTLPFGEAIDGVVELQIEVLSLIEGNPFKIHMRELSWY